MKVELKKKLLGHKGSIYSVFYDWAGQRLLSGGGDGWLVSWKDGERDGQLIAEVGDQIFSLLYLDDSQRIAVGSMSGNLFLISASLPAVAQKKVFHKQGIYDLLMVRHQLVTAGGDGRLGIWNLKTSEIIESVALSHQRLRCMALNKRGDCLAVGSSDGNIYLLSSDGWTMLGVIPKAHEPSVFTLTWLNDVTLLSGGRDAHLKVWDINIPDMPVMDLSAHWFTINHLICHPHLHIVATASRDKTIRIWDLDDLSLLKSLDAAKSGGHINSVNRLAWSGDGAQLYAVSDDASISVWDLRLQFDNS